MATLRFRIASAMPAHLPIDYVEFSVRDLAAAKAFYAAAVGWAFTDYGPGYAGIQRADGGEMGGLEETDAVQAGGPLVVLASDDLDASRAQVEAAGGDIVEPIFAFPGGRRFHFADPSGHVLAVAQYNAAE